MQYNQNSFQFEMEARKRKINTAITRVESMDPTKDSTEIYSQLEEIAGNIEKMSYYLRESLTSYHLQLQCDGLEVKYSYLDHPPDLSIQLTHGILTITFDGLLPFRAVGGTYYLHGKLENAILGFRQAEGMTSPLFLEKCGLIFFHHYNLGETGRRHIRDFDNLEKRCITNVLARHFMVDDNPFAVVSTDVLIESNHTFTEVKICSINDFKSLVNELVSG